MNDYVKLPDFSGVSDEGLNFINETSENFDFEAFVNKLVSGENIFNTENIIDTVLRIFSNELFSAIRILTVIIGIIIISTILENLYNSFEKTGGYNSSFTALALVMGLSVEIFSTTAGYAQTVANDIVIIMNALLPVLMSLTAGCGYISVSLAANPVVLYMCNIFAVIFDKLLIPCSIIYLAVSMLDMLSETVRLSKFRELLKKYYNFVLGIIMTIFTGMLSIGSFAGASLDSLGARGARFALSNMVPFVGRSLSEAMSAVASASMVLKNAVGITGIVVMLLLCTIPILKIAAVILCIRIATVVSESVANRKTVEVLSSVGDSLSMIQAAVISITVMMIISVGIIVGMCG